MRSAERHDDGVGADDAAGLPASMVARVDLLLRAFGPQEQGVGISELARRTGLAKSTVFRIVRELVALGWLDRDGDEVSLGLRLFELGEAAARPKHVRSLALPHMADLRAATGQTVHLAVLEGVEVVYLSILRVRDAPRLPSRIGGRMPAHATGVGKAMLAFSRPEVVERRLAAGLPSVGPRTVTDPAELTAQLARIRTDGLALEREESTAGICCAAAPVLAADGTAVAAISVSAHLEDVDLARVAPAVRTAALALSRRLGQPAHRSLPRTLAGSGITG